MSHRFPDHFSGQAAAYARARPTYPEGLFTWLEELAGAVRVWDCACGSGQASAALARRFPEVIATDASEQQVANAARTDGVHYAAGLAEEAPVASGSIGLTTVAQALHWLRRDAFYAEVRRVSGPDAWFVAWTYGHVTVDPVSDVPLTELYATTLGPYWPFERRFVDARYATLEFPFDAIPTPSLDMHCEWQRDELIDYVATWSAVAAMQRATGEDPLPALRARLAETWPDGERRTVRWPLAIRAGRVRR